MSQSATSSQVTFKKDISPVGGVVFFTGSRRVDGIYFCTTTPTGGGASTLFTVSDIDGNVYFKFATTKRGPSITGSWIAGNGLIIESNRTWNRATVISSADGV